MFFIGNIFQTILILYEIALVESMHLINFRRFCSLGLGFLVSPGGWIDKTMAIGNMGVFELAAKG